MEFILHYWHRCSVAITLGWQRSVQRWEGPETCSTALAWGGTCFKHWSQQYFHDWNVQWKLRFHLMSDYQIDPRHRYGHNLHYYYHRWLHCEINQPFFYWCECANLRRPFHISEPSWQTRLTDKYVILKHRLDVGEGKDVNLEEHCPRWKLHKQCIKYLGPVSSITILLIWKSEPTI